MPALTTEEKLRQKTLYEIGYNYLASHFSKFKTEQKIKVALDVISLFNKDGSKTQDNRAIIYVVNGVREPEQIERDPKQILPPPSAVDNQAVIEQI